MSTFIANALIASFGLFAVGCGHAAPIATDDGPEPTAPSTAEGSDETSAGEPASGRAAATEPTPAPEAAGAGQGAAAEPATQQDAAPAAPQAQPVATIEPRCDAPMPAGSDLDATARAAAWLDACESDPEAAGARLIAVLDETLADPECAPPPADAHRSDRPGAVPACVRDVFDAGRAALGDGTQAPAWQVAAGEAAASFGDHDAVVAWLEPMLAAHPDHPLAESAALELVIAWGWLGRLDDARQLARAWSETSAEVEDALVYFENRACTEMPFGDEPAAAAECYVAIAERWPEHEAAPIARYNACVAWETIGRVDSAHACYTEVVATWPESEVAVDAAYRECFAAVHRGVDAVECFASFSERHPESHNAADALVTACTMAFENEDVARASSCAERFLERFPDHRDAEMLRSFLER